MLKKKKRPPLVLLSVKKPDGVISQMLCLNMPYCRGAGGKKRSFSDSSSSPFKITSCFHPLVWFQLCGLLACVRHKHTLGYNLCIYSFSLQLVQSDVHITISWREKLRFLIIHSAISKADIFRSIFLFFFADNLGLKQSKTEDFLDLQTTPTG